MVRGEIDEKTADIQARSFMARTLGENGKDCQAKGEAKSRQKKSLTSITHENCEGMYFIDLEDKEFKETIRNARKKLELPMAPAMLCKTCKKCKHGETRGKTNEFKSKLACMLGASDPQDCVIAGKGDSSLQHYNLVHKFFPVPQAMKIPAAKAAVEKEW